MKRPLIPAILTYLTYFSSVSGLFARQSCGDSLWCPAGDLGSSLEGTFGAYFDWLLNSQPAPDATPTIPELESIPDDDGAKSSDLPEGTDMANPSTTNLQPDIQIDVTAPPAASPGSDDGCEALLPTSLDTQILPGSTDLHTCETVTAYLIWPLRCDDRAQNILTEQAISKIDGRFLTSRDPLCAFEGGVLFWLAKLTPDQIIFLKKMTTAVRAITPNSPYHFSDLTRTSTSRWAKEFDQTTKTTTDRNKKRAPPALIVVKQKFKLIDPSLTFLSTSLNQENTHNEYAFFSSGGSGVRVYIVDTGLDRSFRNIDFNPQHKLQKSIEWIYALDVATKTTDGDPDGHGTCMASKIGGPFFGVAKRSSLIIAKATPSVGSFIDVLGKVLSAIQKRPFFGRAETVISIAGGWIPPSRDDADAIAIQTLMEELTIKCQAVVVTHAGAAASPQDNYGEIVMYPALLAKDLDIITVGSVQASQGDNYGQSFPWSLSGEALSLSAPGNGYCAGLGPEVHGAEGPSFAGAVVAGLVAYFLGIPELQAWFRIQKNLPGAMMGFVKGLSYKRFMAQESVWNGLDARQVVEGPVQWPYIPA